MNKEKSELDPKQFFNSVGYQFDLKEGKVRPTPEHWQALIRQNSDNFVWSGVSSLAVHVPHRSTHTHRKASPPRSTSYETHTVALEKQLEGPRITRKGNTSPQVAPPSLKIVSVGEQCATRSTITPTKTCSADIYRCIKRRVGHSLKCTARGTWSLPESKLHMNHLELKAVFLALKEFPDFFSNHIVLCALLWRILTWCTRRQVTLKTPGQQNGIAIQTRPNHSNRIVPSPSGLPSHMFSVAPAPSGPVCHQIQQQTATVCVTSSRPRGMGSGCTQPVLGRSGYLCLPTSSHLGQSGGKVAGLPMQQNHTDCSGVAQHALVLGPSGHVQSDSTVSAQCDQSGNSTIQPDPAQEPVKHELACLVPRATAIKEQGFSEAVAARIEAPQRGST